MENGNYWKELKTLKEKEKFIIISNFSLCLESSKGVYMCEGVKLKHGCDKTPNRNMRHILYTFMKTSTAWLHIPTVINIEAISWNVKKKDYMSRHARKLTLWTPREVSTRISLSMPCRFTQIDTFCLMLIFCFRNHYSIPLSPWDKMCRRGLRRLILVNTLRRGHNVGFFMGWLILLKVMLLEKRP